MAEQPDTVSHASLNGIYVKAQELDRGHNEFDAPAFVPPGGTGADAGDVRSPAFTHASDRTTHASNRASDEATHASTCEGDDAVCASTRAEPQGAQAPAAEAACNPDVETHASGFDAETHAGR